MGVLKEDPDNTFNLLERAEEDGPSRRADHGVLVEQKGAQLNRLS